jgi:hypothetical protein
MRNNPQCFFTVREEFLKDVVSEDRGTITPPFPLVAFPTAYLFLDMKYTKCLAKYRFRKQSVGLGIPFDQKDIEQVWAEAQPWISRRLKDLASGRTLASEPYSGLVVVQSVPAGPVVHVPVSFGDTVPLEKDFESVSFDVGLTLLSDPDKVWETFNWGADWCLEKVTEVVDAINGVKESR